MSNEIIQLESKTQVYSRTGLTYQDLDLLFRKPLVKDTIFDLNELTGPYNDFPQCIRLLGHLKRWNSSVNRGEKTSEKELDLFNNLYSMMKCIKYEQSSVQRGNLKKLQQWFLKHFQKHKLIEYQIKHQNIDGEEKNKLFRNREAHEQLKNYIKPYQICLKLFQHQKELKKSKFQKQNESIQRCIIRRNKVEIAKMTQDRQEKEIIRTADEFSQERAKRRMINEKISLKKRVLMERQNQMSYPNIYFSKQTKSLHSAGFNTTYNDEVKNDLGSNFSTGNFKIVEFMKKLNKTGFVESTTKPIFNNSSVESLKLSLSKKPSFNNINKRKLSVKRATTSEQKRSEVSSSSGYRLLVNPFFEKQFKKKKK